MIEATTEPVARRVTERVPIPTIGIGASPACDGQILVTEDLVGLSGEIVPKFVKRYAEMNRDISLAVARYAEDVTARRFPEDRHCFAAAKAADLKLT